MVTRWEVIVLIVQSYVTDCRNCHLLSYHIKYRVTTNINPALELISMILIFHQCVLFYSFNSSTLKCRIKFCVFFYSTFDPSLLDYNDQCWKH